jgi:hypothetical protein
MPKGRPGCFVCGITDEMTQVQVWMRAYTDEEYGNGVRKQASVDSRTRTFCALHAEDAYLAAAAALTRDISTFHGCAKCGARCEFRLHVLMRPSGGPIVANQTGSYCPDHIDPAFEKACEPLAGEWRHTGRGTPGMSGFMFSGSS